MINTAFMFLGLVSSATLTLLSGLTPLMFAEVSEMFEFAGSTSAK